MRPIDADAFAEFLKDLLKEHKYEYLKIDGLLTVADVIEAVISELDGTSFGGFKNAPTVDAVPVVRCKDCIHNTLPRESGNAMCELYYGMIEPWGFCHRGGRR